jgi:S-adenosylmethionine decarboxylase
MFGPHLALDCYQCDQALLEDLSLVYETLDECPDYIGMTKIMPPYVFRYSGKVPEDWGVSGVVLIAESHISIHTFPEKSFMSVDIFSCKCFDVERAVAYMTERFGVGRFEQQLLDRGRHFPKTEEAAGHVMDRQRLISGARGLVRSRSLPHEALSVNGSASREWTHVGVGTRESVYGEPD